MNNSALWEVRRAVAENDWPWRNEGTLLIVKDLMAEADRWRAEADEATECLRRLVDAIEHRDRKWGTKDRLAEARMFLERVAGATTRK